VTEICNGYKSDLIGRILCGDALSNVRGGLGKRSCYSEKERTFRLCTECDLPLVSGRYQRTPDSTHICSKNMRRVVLEPEAGPQKFCQYKESKSKVWPSPTDSEWERLSTNSDSVKY